MMTPTIQLMKQKTGEESYTLNTVHFDGVMPLFSFTLNEEFECVTKGVKMKCIVTFDGNKMIQKMQNKSGKKEVTIEREFRDDMLKVKYAIGELEAFRWYRLDSTKIEVPKKIKRMSSTDSSYSMV